jgi:hypothetical protein
MSIALHNFGPDGRCTNKNNGEKPCGKRLSDISFAAYDREWLGKQEISCRGALLEDEQREIMIAVEAIWRLSKNEG